MSIEQREIARVKERFVKDVAKHEMTVLKDDGLYRHLVFAEPGTNAFRFDLLTWPGHITIVGDMRSMTMARVEDMIQFVGSNSDDLSVDFRYWDEKVVANESPSRKWSSQVLGENLDEALREHLEDTGEHYDSEKANEWQRSLDDITSAGGEYEQQQALFDYDGPVPLGDSWEWNNTLWDYSFLWRCLALRWGANTYIESKRSAHESAEALTFSPT